MYRPRRRNRHGAQICALVAAILLLLSVSLLYSRLNFFHAQSIDHTRSISHQVALSIANIPLLDDSTDPIARYSRPDDLIDEHDDVVNANISADDHLAAESEEEADDDDGFASSENEKASSLYYFDQLNGIIRRGFNKKMIEEWEDYVSVESKLAIDLGFNNEESTTLFGSDDIPINEKTRIKLTQVQGIEEALLLKDSKLRDGWGEWFDKKLDFLRKDKMLKSNFDGVNPLNNPLLQDPDLPGVTGLTRGDKAVQKGLLYEMKKVPFLVKKPLAIEEYNPVKEIENVEVERAGRRRKKKKTLNNHPKSSSSQKDNSVSNRVLVRKTFEDSSHSHLSNEGVNNTEGSDDGEKPKLWDRKIRHGELLERKDTRDGIRQRKDSWSEFSGLIFADGSRWGYYPGLDSRLSFNNFMDAFFRKGKCRMRVFMVWNSAPWMFGVRHQRCLESILFHNREACVVVLSETLELNFFRSFVADG